MRGIIVLSLALAGLAGQSLAQAPDSVITKPNWAQLPNARDIVEYMPNAARQGVSGRATINCRVTKAGRLRDCSVLNETPEGLGFGAAAVKMAVKFRMKPQALDGRPVDGGVVILPIVFKAN
jgi:protein TonB